MLNSSLYLYQMIEAGKDKALFRKKQGFILLCIMISSAYVFRTGFRQEYLRYASGLCHVLRCG